MNNLLVISIYIYTSTISTHLTHFFVPTPATVLSPEADRSGLGMSLFERLERAGHPLVMLTVQYRMNPGLYMSIWINYYMRISVGGIELCMQNMPIYKSIHVAYIYFFFTFAQCIYMYMWYYVLLF
jgi:hypothetical protein